MGNGGNDQMAGGGGNDQMAGGVGNDLMFGDSGRGGKADMTRLHLAEDVSGKVTFQGESAGYKNALGVYKIDADGRIYDVDIVWANASLKGSGGNLVSGASSEALKLKAGDKLGFFVVPDSYSQSGMAKLLDDQKGSWKFVDARGNPGNVDGGKELKLVHVSAEGKSTDIKSTYGTSVFHSVDDGSKGLNGDKLNHVVGSVDTATGTIKIGFEDLKGGGDKDYDDSVFTLNIGVTNAALTAKVGVKPAGEKNDAMEGGAGDDKMFGMSGHDTVDGGAGDDRMWGNSGNDVMHGGDGNDDMRGGSGDDVMSGGAGDDNLQGNSGNDTFLADAGNDRYDGQSGFDTLDYSKAAQGITMDLSKHTVVGDGKDEVWGVERVVGSAHDDMMQGDKNANVLDGGAGNDVLRGMGGADTLTGGEGNDTFRWLAKDLGEVDVVTDFGKGDTLDFSKLLKGVDYESIDEVLAIKDDGRSSHVYAAVGESWVEVVTLEGVTGLNAHDMLKDGMLLA